MEILYPKGPELTNDDFTRPSALFKSRVSKVIVALVLFAIIYISLLIAGIAIAAFLAICGGTLIFYIHNIFVIAFGAGLIIAGLMVLYFLVKFLFERKKMDRSGMTEIFEQDEPVLFEFIRRLSQETGTDFPKHIYISTEVNASVFYDSTLKSMFFPVRKNLLIGMGLVNMVNVSELKSVIAHEFGHFSQKSMRAGSYVYQVNQAIYNMLYENQNYHNILVSWANIHSAFALCARITISLVTGIQNVQKLAYKMVNKQYSLLTQQMEFHADAMSAMAAGSNNAIHALRRIEFADDCYNTVLQKYNEWVALGLKGSNLYTHQRIIAGSISTQFKLKVNNGLPLLGTEGNNYMAPSRINIVEAWASHPTMQQREEALKHINVNGEVIEESAWVLFSNPKTIQETLTKELYENAKFKIMPRVADDELFIKEVKEAEQDTRYPALYDQYYRGREISKFDPFTLSDRPVEISNLEQFFTLNSTINTQRIALEKDIRLLMQIEEKTSGIKSFDYNGEKYKASYASTIRTTLESELKALVGKLQDTDEQVFLYLIHKAAAISDATRINIQTYYKQYYEIQGRMEENLKFCNHFLPLVEPCIDKTYSVENNMKMAAQLQEATEALMSRVEKLAQYLADPALHYKFTIPASATNLKKMTYTNLNGSKFAQNEIKIINDCIHEFGNWSYNSGFYCQKQLLERQLALLGIG